MFNKKKNIGTLNSYAGILGVAGLRSENILPFQIDINALMLAGIILAATVMFFLTHNCIKDKIDKSEKGNSLHR